MTGCLDGDSRAPTNMRSAGLEATYQGRNRPGNSRQENSIELASCLPLMFWTLIGPDRDCEGSDELASDFDSRRYEKLRSRFSARSKSADDLTVALPVSPLSFTRSIEIKEEAGKTRCFSLWRRRSTACSQSGYSSPFEAD